MATRSRTSPTPVVMTGLARGGRLSQAACLQQETYQWHSPNGHRKRRDARFLEQLPEGRALREAADTCNRFRTGSSYATDRLFPVVSGAVRGGFGRGSRGSVSKAVTATFSERVTTARRHDDRGNSPENAYSGDHSNSCDNAYSNHHPSKSGDGCDNGCSNDRGNECGRSCVHGYGDCGGCRRESGRSVSIHTGRPARSSVTRPLRRTVQKPERRSETLVSGSAGAPVRKSASSR